MRGLVSALSVLALSSALVLAAGMPELPPGGEPIVSDFLSGAGTGEGEAGRSEIVEAAGPSFARAVRVSSSRRGEPWDMQVIAPVRQGLQRGDTLLLRFWARTVQTSDESGQGYVWANIGEGRPPWTKSLDRTFAVLGEWQPFVAGGRCRRDYQPGDLNLSFGVGHTVQTIEIGGVELLNFGTSVSARDLPVTRTTYPGREPDAPWRAPAAERIRDIRTAPFTVRVTDAAGRPVEGAQVSVQMVRHAFEFGAAVTAWRVADSEDSANDRYRERILELFNAGSFVNILKWPPWEGNWGDRFSREIALGALKWMKDNGIAFRGHVLVWPSWSHVPRSMRQYRDDPDADAVRQRVLDHIDNITTVTRGYVAEWDVINEPYHNHDLMDICGRQVMADWFKRARRNLPDAGLALNDFGILTALTPDPHQDDFEETIRYLLENGAPLTVLGIQGHFGGTVPSPDRMLATLDRFAEFGVPVRITEFTVGTGDEQLRADFLRDAMTTLFSHPSVIGFQFWEMGQLLNDDLTPKPAYDVYRNLVFREWWTDVAGTTDEGGGYSGRGFLGHYRATATLDGKEFVREFELAQVPEGAVVSIDTR